ncbi:hypothetical protein IQ268_19850 [Oculatella sp. LEGE 06141]|uniref:hypothetical protein n=1 Tax=Oculatella sp. LEGE 06141 TaxID=1828648 RepID=UPI00187E0B7B|nr:hypothetical protein [Oculatella sp. LEGE 06141]MBE9180818.1 hypothetical protein [Oculatella sp. LEGE 06141]
MNRRLYSQGTLPLAGNSTTSRRDGFVRERCRTPSSWFLPCLSLALAVVSLMAAEGAIAQPLTLQRTNTIASKTVQRKPNPATWQEGLTHPQAGDVTTAQELLPVVAPLPASSPAEQLNLDPAIIEGSPVLQRWLEQVPNVQAEMQNDPGFRTRLHLGYVQVPSTDDAAGVQFGVEDVFLGRSGATVSADVETTLDGDRQTYGADLRYYVLPLGNYVNLAPVVGYRRLETDAYTTDGLHLGLRLQLTLSRTGAADLSVSQTWVNPGQPDEEVGITSVSVGYAVTQQLRFSTQLQRQNAPQDKDSRVGVGLEWML